jgi:hypothetical protein
MSSKGKPTTATASGSVGSRTTPSITTIATYATSPHSI